MLILISTPIGNLGDLSARAGETLCEVDFIACEDTRQTGKLLHLTGLNSPAKLLPYHDHNGAEMRPKLISLMQAGKKIALVSDAGTPLISDPGYKLVAACHDHEIAVSAVPGPSAALMALTISGLPSDQFGFYGFVPAKQKQAREAIADAGQHPMTQIWFESPRRCAQTLKLFAEIQGNRKIAISRELTKLYEQVERGTLAELASHYAEQEPPKGEMVLVIEGCATDKKMDEDEILSLLTEKLNQLSLRDAVREVEGLSGRRHKEIYQLALQIRQEKS